jgi:hypothetical protein
LRIGGSVAAGAAGVAVLAVVRVARADPPPEARVTADDVTLDAHTQALSLQGHVDVEADPFHLTSDALRVTRTSRGLVVEGAGRVAFCPCIGEPVALVFRGATVAPPGDLFLVQPRLEIETVPVFWLPYFWLRSSGRVGLLPPEVAYRGSDGVFLGDGVHVPWKSGDTEAGLDLRAGAYVEGGVAVESTLRTPSSVTTLRWDELHQDGFAVDARGSTATEGARGTTLSWDADLLRGERGVVSTTDLDAAARVYDRAAAESSWHGGGWVLAAGVMAENVRGSGVGELDAGGPVVRARDSGALGSVGAYDATVESGSLSGAGLVALSFARADMGGMVASRWGPTLASLDVRGAADWATQGETDGYDTAASARARLTLPVVRTFASDDPMDAWRHRVEPEIEAGVLAAQGDGLLGEIPSPGGIAGVAWLADAGVKSALGRWGTRQGFEGSEAMSRRAPSSSGGVAPRAPRYSGWARRGPTSRHPRGHGDTR